MQQPGMLQHLAEINRGMNLAPFRFAAGGLVGESVRQTSASLRNSGFGTGGVTIAQNIDAHGAASKAGGRGRLLIGVDQTALIREMEGNAEFPRMIARVTDRHRKKFNNDLGRGVQ